MSGNCQIQDHSQCTFPFVKAMFREPQEAIAQINIQVFRHP
jgi:hypothetical protein